VSAVRFAASMAPERPDNVIKSVAMSEKTPLFSKVEITALAVCGALVVLHVIFWRQLRGHPVYSLSLLGLIILLAAGFWIYRNYRLVSVRAKRIKAIEEKLEGIVYSLFFPRGYDLLEPFRVDQQDIGWAALRDSAGIPVTLQYIDIEMNHPVESDRIQRLIERMNVENAPKGVSLTTGIYEEEALALARRSNILTRDGQQLVEMVKRAEEEAAGADTHICPHCSSKLVESADITGLWRCPNPNCRKEFKIEDLEESGEEHGHKGPRNVNAFTISCYGCGRPVELDTAMSGLMECPYDDCSWIINVDNELLALRGGLDKRVSERLTEIKCPRCDRMIKVPADAEGLMECPCEEKWIIDVGAALGERAQAQIAEGSGAEVEAEHHAPVVRRIQALEYTGTFTARTVDEPSPEEETGRLIERAMARARRIVAARKMQAAASAANFELARENPALESAVESDSSPAPGAETHLVDCPGCGAGVPSGLDACPVCGAALLTVSAEGQTAEPVLNVETVPLAATRGVTHRRTFFAMSTPVLIFLFIFSILAFLAFVYFITR